MLKKEYVIKKWNESSDYWSYYHDGGNAFNNSFKDNFVGGTVHNAHKFSSHDEAERRLSSFLMYPAAYYVIQEIYSINNNQ